MSTPIDGGPAAHPAPRPSLWRRPAVVVLAALAIATLVVVLVLFQPQRLLYDVAVDDEFPMVEDGGDDAPSGAPEELPEAEAAGGEAAGSVEAEGDESTAPDGDLAEEVDDGEEGDPATEEPVAEPSTEPSALATGTFESRNRYTTTGTATAFELPDGTRTLRLEDFETTNGPDLYVYLTVSDAADSDAELDADFVDLGDLRGNVGNQNYPIPDDVDLDRYDTVVIWCLRFTSSFGVADLAAELAG